MEVAHPKHHGRSACEERIRDRCNLVVDQTSVPMTKRSQAEAPGKLLMTRHDLPAHFARSRRGRPPKGERALLDALIVSFWAGVLVTICVYLL